MALSEEQQTQLRLEFFNGEELDSVLLDEAWAGLEDEVKDYWEEIEADAESEDEEDESEDEEDESED